MFTSLENNAKPDFLFPSFHVYHSPTFPAAELTLLGAKTTCKDRWRQVLAEGSRIPRKHLATLEAAISTAQKDEMAASNLQLVVPLPVQTTYTAAQRTWLQSLADFIAETKAREKSA